MSKITFRADDDLVRRIEALDASKSEVMREALHEYLDGSEEATAPDEGTLDELVARRVDELVDQRLVDQPRAGRAQDVNVNITLDGATQAVSDEPRVERDATRRGQAQPASNADHACAQCGETVADDHVYCPNCGEKASRRLFCDCGDEIRTDWAFCPSCGRRTPSADVLDRS